MSAIDQPVIIRGHFSPQECEAISATVIQMPVGTVAIDDAGYQHRHATISWIARSEKWRWLWERFGKLQTQINRSYGFDLVEPEEAIQWSVYGPGDQFDWHMDLGGGLLATRKLTIAVQLSDPASYVGGAIQILGLGEPSKGRIRGTVIAFPSYLVHRVTPIAHGQRQSLVLWWHGPSFR